MGKTARRLICLALGTTAAWAIAIKPRTKDKPDLSVFSAYDYARGGCHDFKKAVPENSLAAFKEAYENGYGIAVDVRVTKDGIPVAFADHELWRMCGTNGNIETCTQKELSGIRLLETEEKIPSLSEIMKLVDGKVPVLIRLHVWEDNFGTLCRRCAEVLDEYEGVYAVESLDYRAVKWFKDHRPNVIRGQMLEKTGGRSDCVYDQVSKFAKEWLLTNIIAAPDFICCNIMDKGSLSLRFCKLLYHVPIMHFSVTSEEEYESSRLEDAMVTFDEITP